ncbi:MAG TPA: electron transport complex subunit RsxD [Methylococcales bacterium]|nr:electron transport complex subunit RsxD [Methylococcales bacterium]
MNFSWAAAPHIKPRDSVSKIMLKVLVALLPSVLLLAWFFGGGVYINILLATSTALIAEAMVLKLRGRAVLKCLKDLSALVTAVLIAMAIPTVAPWWVVVLGTFFAIVIVKQLYGGLGSNLFNPAMAGYAFLLISFPQEMTAWAMPGSLNAWPFSDIIGLIFSAPLPGAITIDGITMATPLDAVKTQVAMNQHAGVTVLPLGIETLFAQGWGWLSLSYFVGGLWLVQQGIIAWQIPLGILSALALIAAGFYFYDAQTYTSPLFHLLAGATMVGAFFIATDPVTAATAPKGRFVFGFMIGVLTYLIRVWGGYPDAMAFAVLLMNIAVPVIDYYTQPRVFGTRR